MMKRLNINTILFIAIGALVALFSLVSCNRDFQSRSGAEDDTDGAIVFGQFVSGTKTWTRDDALIAQYAASDVDREFQVEMYKKVGDTPTKVGETMVYETSTDYPADGALVAKDTPLYWPDNVTEYAFRATAGNKEIQADQSTGEKFYDSDYVLGFGYEALKESDTAVDNIDTLNYHTSKQWYAMNAVSYGTGVTAAKQKTVPLFLKHKKSRISIILKAGKGVDRSKLAFVNAGTSIKDTIYSYSGGTATEIIPYATEKLIDYEAQGSTPAQSNVSTTCYDAIVEPYDYFTDSEKIITRINASDMKFSFYSRNDSRFSDPAKQTEMQCYNLQAGQHLVITALLETGSHIMVLSANTQDWDETETFGVADDFGQNGDPIEISTGAELVAYLSDDTMNKAGKVALVTASELDLTSWTANEYTLKGTLNLAGATIKLSNQFIKTIDTKGNLLNGNFEMSSNSTVESAICETNKGTISSITVNNSADTTAKATVAGLVENNYNKIYNCKSYLPVEGTTGCVGGIAGQSVSDSGSLPVIDGCQVSCSVKGSGTATGGGIVGLAEGTVSNNTNSYGITISQNSSTFLNIVGAKASGTLTASGNGWTTNAANDLAGTNVTANQVDGIIDCQADVLGSFDAAYNTSGKVCAILGDFSVNGDSWTPQNISYTLQGNGHTIILTGTANAKRLFNDISNSQVSDIIIDVQKPIVDESDDNDSATAALAYKVSGADGRLENIKVKTTHDAYIQAANPAGVVVWATGGATVSSCQFQGSIKVKLARDLDDGACYCGGIVSMAVNATVTGCVCHTASPFSRVDSYKDDKLHIKYGGIVGGTKGSSASDLLLTDCTSNFYIEQEADGYDQRKQCGSIIGLAKYTIDETHFGSTLATGCQGNWWINGQYAISLDDSPGTPETKYIGKCNAIKPTLDSEW